MTPRTILIALTLGSTMGRAQAEPPPPADALSAAYDAAIDDLCAGKDRQKIADRLKPIVDKNASSPYHPMADEFLVDLTESAKNPPKSDAEPENRLADTRIEFSVLRYAENWDGGLKKFIEEEPKDPSSRLLGKDRSVIDRLLPLLHDRSPARVDRSIFISDGRLSPQPRVCDVALAIIEYHALCRFHHDQIFGTILHQLPPDRRETIIKRVGEWWNENKDKPVAAGVRAQIPHAGSYPEQVWMAKTLVRLGEGQKTDDKEFGLNVLRNMVKEDRWSHVAAYAADALAEFGDLSALDVFYEEWKSSPHLTHDSHVTFYLCAHGKRREWEQLHAISLEEFRQGKGPGDGAVWAAVINSGKAGTNPYAIPILGLALGYTELTGSRYFAGVGSQQFSSADTAAEHFQKQVGKDFGYKPTGTEEERGIAIQNAKHWWETEGKAKYTFDFIEKNLVAPKPPPPEK